MKFLLLTLLISSLPAFGASFNYGGIEGKISNLSNFDNSKIQFKALILGWRGSSVKKSFSLYSDISNDGSFKIKGDRVSCSVCKFSVRHAIILTKPDGKKASYEVGKVMRDERSILKNQNYTVIGRPTFRVPLTLKDGRTLGEWFKAKDRPLHSPQFKAVLFNGSNSQTFLDKPIYLNGNGTLSPEGEFISLVVNEGYLPAKDLKMKLTVSFSNVAPIASLVTAFSTSKGYLKQAVKSLRLDTSGLSSDMNGLFKAGYGFSTLYKKDKYGYMRRIADKDLPTIVKLLKLDNAKFSCEQGLSKTTLAFGQLEQTELTGTCTNIGSASYKIDSFIAGDDSVAVDLRGATLEVERTFLGSIQMAIIAEDGKEIVSYSLGRKK